jgi:membrane protein insertase Oxa1/YidC/SpoIIIJ
MPVNGGTEKGGDGVGRALVLDNFAADRLPDQLRDRMKLELKHDVAAMGLRCLLTAAQEPIFSPLWHSLMEERQVRL